MRSHARGMSGFGASSFEMKLIFGLCLVLAVLSDGFCATLQSNEGSPGSVNRSRDADPRDLLVCGLTRDVSCFLDTADALVARQTRDILAQADREVAGTSGRADGENSPSHLGNIIDRLISEFTEAIRDTLSGFFKSAREGEDDEVAEENKEDDKGVASQERSAGEPRKKKKIKKLIALIKLLVIGAVLLAKFKLLLKLLSTALQVKFFLVALSGLILNAARFYLDLKKKHEPQKVIYYEHAQHQHHYDGDDDWHSSGPGGSYWGRSYDVEETSPQDLAYAKQKPHKTKENTSNFSWLG